MKTYELNTVTYATKSAPYLATRCLKQVSYNVAQQYPEASTVISRDFYVDDLLSGAETIESASKLKNDLTIIFKEYCFELRK